MTIFPGTACMHGGVWYASEKIDAPMVKHFRNTVQTYGNHCGWFMTPDTARSMADALREFADRAEAFK